MIHVSFVSFSDSVLVLFFTPNPFLCFVRNKRPEFTAWLAEVKQVFNLPLVVFPCLLTTIFVLFFAYLWGFKRMVWFWD